MLGMNRVDDSLASRKYELARCQKRHSDLLRSLFETTSSTLKLNHIKQPHHDLATFLESNDLLLGRSFDLSTLPSTAQLLNARRPDSHGILEKPGRSPEGAIDSADRLPGTGRRAENVSSERSGEPDVGPASLPTESVSPWVSSGPPNATLAVERPVATGKDDVRPLSKVRPCVDPIQSSTLHGATHESSLPRSEGPPSGLDDMERRAPVQTEESVAQQRPWEARSVYPSPEGIQEQPPRDPDHEASDRLGKNESSHDNAHLISNAPAPPTFDIGTERGSNEQDVQGNNSERRSNATPKSHLETAKAEAFEEASSTPDEQLRLEEAQSIHLSKASANVNEFQENASREMPPPASLQSEYIDANMIDGGFVTEIPDADSRMAVSQGHSLQDHQGGDNKAAMRFTSGLRDDVFSGMNKDSSRDLTFSRRPPMRIDTGVPSIPDSISIAENKSAVARVPTPSEVAIPSKSAAAVGSAQSPPERMTTRVSSGAIRHKSVSEILGETPKPASIQFDKRPHPNELGDSRRDDSRSLQTPKSASSFTTPDPATFKRRLSELKEKERSKPSTVIFTNPRNEEIEPTRKDRDYLLTLFNYQVASLPRAHTLNTLVKGSHKTLATADHYIDFNERQSCRLLNRIYELQSKNSWSLRQIERAPEPSRPVSHWDVLLNEAKWLRTDFREERKFKMAAAKYAANACAAWIAGNSLERKSLQVKVRSRPYVRENSTSIPGSTPDLVHSVDDEVSDETDDESLREMGNAPAAIFSLPSDMFIFGLNRTPAAEDLLQELPLYQPNATIQDAALGISHVEPDAGWKNSLVPVSKYVQGKILPLSKPAHGRIEYPEQGPPRKKSRFNYYEADVRSKSNDSSGNDTGQVVEPEQDDVALFDPEHKHIRDRIHTGHAFRPPSEYAMPSQQFFESRLPSQWTQAEDDELRRAVKEYSYNWSLISSSLTLPSMFSSGAERRTPWECFERWISLEGLPVEMAKINYFKAYFQRLQLAQKTVEANQPSQQQQQGNNASSTRRRTTQPYSVERRRDVRHIHVIDAMKKLAKKRETALNKQEHVARTAAMRKAAEPVKSRTTMHTPQEFSRMKYDRQVKYEEQARQYRAAMQHQKNAQAAKASQQSGHQINGVQPIRNAVPNMPNGSSPNMTNANPHGQMRGVDPLRPVQQMQRPVNGQMNGILPTNSHSVPHAPMQPSVQMQMQMQQRIGSGMAPDRIMQDVARVQAQQQLFQQQQLRPPGHPSSNGHAGLPSMQNPSYLSQSNSAMLASAQGRSSPSINGVSPSQGPSTSPRMAQPQTLSSGVTPAVNQISSQFKARHPQASPEQITRMTTEQLYKISSDARHQAMVAAAGNANMNAVASNANNSMGLATPSPLQQAAMLTNGGNNPMNPQHYAQMMRTQQAGQQRGAGTGNGQGMSGNNMNGNAGNLSRSGTPLIQRTSSAQGGPRPSQSPSSRPVGLAGGQ